MNTNQHQLNMNNTLIYPKNNTSNRSQPEGSIWNLISDQVMGGVSQGVMQDSGQIVNMQGRVSLENNGGFIQLQTILPTDLYPEQYQGVFIEVCTQTAIKLQLVIKSSQLWMPWQSYRAEVKSEPNWQTFKIPFEHFEPYKTKTRLNPKKMTKFAVLAGGQTMDINASIRQFGFYK